MQHFELKGQTRQVGNKAVIKAFRKEGLVPCNLYGLGMDNVLFTVVEKDLKGLLNTPNSFIVDITLDKAKKPYTAILHEVQYHPVKDNCLHIDFLAVNEKKPIAIDVPLVITGHSVGVQQGGKFTQNARKVRVSGLMKNLPDEITVDISSLQLDKRIKAGDLKYEGLTIVSDKDMIICGVKSTRNMVAAVETAE